MSEIVKSDIQSAIDAGRELGVKVEFVNGTPTIIAPEAWETTFFEDLREIPLRVEETVKHTTVASFLEYCREFSTPSSAIFLDTSANTFTAVLDYHGVYPGWCKHKATYSLKPTKEWTAWTANDKKTMSQEEFGRFIEDNLVEITQPPSGKMLEVALSLQAKTKVDFSRAVRLDNGETQFQYVENIEGKAGINGAMKIPDLFTIGLVLYEGGDAYQVDARFRYRIREGGLTLWYELVRPHKTVEANIADTRKAVEEGMGQGGFYVAAR